MQHLSTPVAARRAVLGAGIAGLGVVVTGAPALAAGGTAALEVLPPETTTWVATGSRSRVRVPAVLGARLRTGSVPLPKGTTAELSWDRRVYERTVPVLTADDGRSVPVRLVAGPTTGEATDIVTATVRTGASMPAHRSFVLTLGTRRPLRYPHDVVADPAPLAVGVGDPRHGARRSVRPEADAATLWGAVVGAGWEPLTWGDGFHSWMPSIVTVRAVGPGAVPSGTSVEVVLDGRVARSVEARTADGVVRARGRRDGDLLRLRWTLDAPLPADARRSVRLAADTVAPAGGLDLFQAPTVSVLPLPGDPGQRITGGESVCRADNAVDAGSRATFGLDILTG